MSTDPLYHPVFQKKKAGVDSSTPAPILYRPGLAIQDCHCIFTVSIHEIRYPGNLGTFFSKGH